MEKDVDILFDSGAGISVMSEELFPELVSNKSHKVYGIGGVEYAGEPIECKILISSTWETKHVIKPMPIPDRKNLLILGRDFLQHFGTTEFDWTNQKVRIGKDWIFMVSEDHTQDVTSIINKCKFGQNLDKSQKESIKMLLEDFCQVFVKNSKAPKLCTTEVHRIFSRDDRVCKDKVHRIPDKWKGEVNQQVIEMLNNGIIRPSKSPYNSNPLLVTKQDNSKRFVIDFRNLNKNTIQDSYPLPDVNDMIDACLNCNYFTQLDLASGYWCLEVHEDDKKVLAHNNTVNKSLKYSPFLCMFADRAQLPVDNYMGLKEANKQKLSGKIIRQDANINLQEAKIQYKEQHDKKGCSEYLFSWSRSNDEAKLWRKS